MSRTAFTILILAGTLAAGSLHAATVQKISGEEANARLEQKLAERRASLAADAHAAYVTRAEERKVQALYAAREARTTQELANYSRFKFDQRLAIAEASASRHMTIINNYSGSEPGNSQEAVPSSLGSAAPTTSRRDRAAYRPLRDDRPYGFDSNSGANARLQHYPDRFFAREAREQGADESVAAATARETSAQQYDTAHPAPGLVTSPDRSHYLDLRGYRSGESVRDPYDGRILTVP